jgi:predicted alpha/beta superfamily hydrolase
MVFSFCFISFFSTAQFKITFQITGLPAYHNQVDDIFIAGSFNNWNPAQAQTVFEKDKNGNLFLTLAPAKGKYEYKLTRGSWEKVESGAAGFPLENRMVEVNSDTVIKLNIQHWADHFPKKIKASTANKNVQIIETAFFIPQLNRTRRIWIYLPESYSSSRKKYPVLYMHDGQNVFEDTTSFSGEWGVDEAMDTLGKSKEMIVVAIDNGGDKRLNEYAPFDMERFGKAEGDEYVAFLINTLRPYINKKYRTKKCGKHNYVAGSSMGGLISFYAILKYPKKWGGAGVFSPAFWIVPQLKNIVSERSKKVKGKIYFYAGKQEGEEMVPDMLTVFSQMNQYSKAKMETVIRSEGKHNEATWRKEFPLFYKWLTSF